MREIVLFFIISLSCLNANAQLGDFFRKLGDTIDSVSKKTVEDSKNQSNEESNNHKRSILIYFFFKTFSRTSLSSIMCMEM